MNKSYILLGMYEDLITGQAIKIGEFCAEHGISVSTFRRYIACLRCFLADRRGDEIVYLSERSEYVLEKKK